MSQESMPSTASAAQPDSAPESGTDGVAEVENVSKAGRRKNILRGLATYRFSQSDNNPVKVFPGLFVGSIGAANNVAELKNQQISAVLSLCMEKVDRIPSVQYRAVTDLKDQAEENLGGRLHAFCDYIKVALDGGGCVLVHCFQGKSRSVSVVAAFLIREHGMTLTDALNTIRAVRPVADPNLGFLVQLRRFERECREAAQQRASERKDDAAGD